MSSSRAVAEPPVHTLTEMIFRALPHRSEDGTVLLGHEGDEPHPLSLTQLRTLVADLYDTFEERGIEPGQTVMLVATADNCELFPAVTFFALTSYGVRVLLPTYAVSAELEDWCELAEVSALLTAQSELGRSHRTLGALREAAARQGVRHLDLHDDLDLRGRVQRKDVDPDVLARPSVAAALARTGPETEALIVTTSGSSGSSKLVVYAHGAYPRQCASWQAAGLFAPDVLGGRGFTPLFAHTIGIRGLVNGLWTGAGSCLLDTESLKTNPDRVLRMFAWMAPEHVTGGPSLFRLLLSLLAEAPEASAAIAANLKCLVSIGAPFDPATSAEIEAVLGMRPHNAFGTTETQMALCTLLGRDAPDDSDRPLGEPLPGVELELTPVAEGTSTLHLAIRSPFGLTRYLTPHTALRPDGFFESGDLVVASRDGTLRSAGRV